MTLTDILRSFPAQGKPAPPRWESSGRLIVWRKRRKEKKATAAQR
jgi:hypothetical protein